MQYSTLYASFKNLFPEDHGFFEELETENLVDSTVGMHPIFGLIVVPYILLCVRENRAAETNIAFTFLEEMATCKDADVAGVLDFTVLESFVDEGHDFIRKCKQYMGKNTLEHCEEIEKYFL